MSFFTGLALSRRPVTILAMILIIVMGVFAYNNFQRELFPEIEFPNITVVTVYPNSDPETVVNEVSEPIEDAISGMAGLKEVQSTSSENISIILATFEFGEDMEEAEGDIENAINGITFPDEVNDPVVSRINSDTFPAIQLSILGDRDIPSIQRLLDDVIIPQVERVDGVFNVDILGSVDEQAFVTVDTDKLEDLGLTMQDVSNAIRQNNLSFPGGDLNREGTNFPIRTKHELGSIDDMLNLTIGFEGSGFTGGAPAARTGARPIVLSDVAEIEVSTADPRTISRTNGKPSLSIAVLKDPDANTVDVTEGVIAALDEVQASGILPSDIEILILSNDGPEVKKALDSLLREGLLGFLFAISVVFIFLLNLRPSMLRGVVLSLRPTVIIGISIPLSILTGILFMSLTDITLNFMSLAGLAIAVGRVVDDSIVVLENIYRHIQRGDDRLEAAYEATKEVGAAIVASTLTTIVVFVPLTFIQGLVGEFFSPFAISVSLALLASTIVALTAVPVLGAIFLVRDESSPMSDTSSGEDSLIQKIYTPILVWALRRKLATIAIALVVTVASMFLTLVIPVTFFPAGTPQFLTVDVELPTGTSIDQTFIETLKIERVLQDFEERGFVETYQVTLGSLANEFGPGAAGGGFDTAGFFIKLEEDVPDDIADQLRVLIPESDNATITVKEISNGPPADGLEVNITGPNFNDISSAARDLEASFADIDGLINLSSNVSEGKGEVVINVNPQKAAEFGLDTFMVGAQVNQFIVGQEITEIDIENVTMDVVLRGQPNDVNDIEKIKNLTIEGPLGRAKLGSIADIGIENGPVTITRFDSERSASITGTIVAEDTQAIGVLVNEKIAALDLPPGVEVKTGGIFTQIAEGFNDVFSAMAIGIVLVYLVMVATLGSLRNPFIIVLSLPLAIVGALVALAITGRSLSLSAMMGFLLLIGIVVTNAIVLLTFVEQLRERGYGVYEALIEGGRVRLRPILMTAFTTTFALLPLAASGDSDSAIIGAELATVVIGGLVSSTFLTLVAVPVMYIILNESLPGLFAWIGAKIRRDSSYNAPRYLSQEPAGDD